MRTLPPPLSEDLEARLGAMVGAFDGVDRDRAEAALAEASEAVLDAVPRGTREAWADEAPRRAFDLVLIVAARLYERGPARPGPVLVPRERTFARRLALGQIPPL